MEENKGMDVVAFDNSADLKKKVTRGEVIEIIKQVVDNVNQISSYLMEDVNTLYANQLFPFQIQTGVLEDILVEKGVISKEELKSRYDDKIKLLQEKAKEIKESEDGLRFATKDEEKNDVNEKVLNALNNKED